MLDAVAIESLSRRRKERIAELEDELLELQRALRARGQVALGTLAGILVGHPDDCVERARRAAAAISALSNVAAHQRDAKLRDYLEDAYEIATQAQLAAARRQAFAELR
jgi:hypothetical protein